MSKHAAILGLAAVASATYSASAVAPTTSSLPDCWSSCFASNGVTSESDLCGNTGVDACIQDSCTSEEDQAYWGWYGQYCPSPSSSSPAGPISSSAPVYPSSSGWYPSASSSYPDGPISSSGYPVEYPSSSGWYPSASSSYPDGPISSSVYPVGYPSSSGWYPSASSSYPDGPISSSYPVYPSASSSYPVGPISSSVVPSSFPTPSCWAECFEKYDVSSEDELCGDYEVSACIHDSCCREENEAYWTWYDSFCPTPSSSSYYPVYSSYVASSSIPFSPVSSSGVPSSTPTPVCWTDCFESNGVTSEDELCNNAAVSSCIFTTCDKDDDKAYWFWYESYCPVPSASVSVFPVSSSAAPTPTPTCWSSCFAAAEISSEDELCGNTQVNSCIYTTCSPADDKAYWAWYESYCPYPSSSVSYIPSSTSYPSSTPTVDCWGKCFAEYQITSEDELCGNTDVDACIQQQCSCEEDKAYWAWYDSFCTDPTPSSSAPSYTTPEVPATSTSDCWGSCFASAGIASESELCGNVAVDECIHDECSAEEDKAYWQWYNSFCPVTTTATITIPSATPTPDGNCWNACFAEFDVTSEASLCGNDQVSYCIHSSCSSDLDAAYWDWYNGFCAPATSTVVTVITTVTVPAGGVPTGYTDGGYTVTDGGYTGSVITTTYITTSTIPATPIETSPATYGLPSPPASTPVGPVGYGSTTPASPVGYSTPVAQPTGGVTGYPSPSASSWSPVPATGAGAMNKPGFFIAAAMALVALF